MLNRRRKKRRHLIYYLDVIDGTTHKQIGHVADLTSEGVLILTEAPLAEGQELDLEITAPNVPGLKSEQLRVHATVRWTGYDRNPALKCVGCQIEPLQPKEQAVVDLLVKLVGFSDS